MKKKEPYNPKFDKSSLAEIEQRNEEIVFLHYADDIEGEGEPPLQNLSCESALAAIQKERAKKAFKTTIKSKKKNKKKTKKP